MQPDYKSQPFGAARLAILHCRRHSLFAAQVMMALTVVALLTLTIAGAENYLAGGKSLSTLEAARAIASAHAP